MAGMMAILGDTVLGKDGKNVPVSKFANPDSIVGLYFSAHWCPPCRGFTPVLAEVYKNIKQKGKKFEVIFISSDRDQKSYAEYYETMPWLTIGFGSEKKSDLAEMYEVGGIPCLVLLKGDSGELITKDGRSKILNEKGGFPWTA
ncbi:uncharacterized protein [Littorina saxatilis]|uniref:protein-disulfide reductase n=1 Tax=Littorina saxatilis TaxID=31220 RepID=A0AAN9BUC2_9CAEN